MYHTLVTAHPLIRCYPISKEVHEAIIAASEQAETKGVAADPITGERIHGRAGAVTRSAA